MRLPVSRIILLVCALLAVVPATAGAATSPKVTSVKPLKLKIGERLTIRGKGFLPGKNRNTVVFKATGTRAVFVKAQSATKTKLVVKVPVKLLSFFDVQNGKSVATRFQIRVLARRLSKAYTPVKGSPVIEPVTVTTAHPVAPGATPTNPGGTTGDGATAPTAPTGPGATKPPAAAVPVDTDRDGQPDSVDPDDDDDLLPDTVEAAIGTSPLVADSDGDGMTDGWEYKSALDLEQRSCPVGDYPTVCAAAQPSIGKRPYPNPLYSDADTDYDGDSLTAGEEFRAWTLHAQLDPAWNTLGDLWYSDGLQASQDTSYAPGCRGMGVPYPFTTQYPPAAGSVVVNLPEFTAPVDVTQLAYAVYTLDRVGSHAADGCLDDAERDEDGDFLTNFDETHGPLMDANPNWFQAVYQEPDFRNVFRGTDWLVADTDGNGIVDGLDDQDHDDFLNVEEVTRGPLAHDDDGDTTDRSGLWVQPFNPCLPDVGSRTCPTTVLLSGKAWYPFVKRGEEPPALRWPLYDPAGRDVLAPWGLPYADNGTPEVWDYATAAGLAPGTLPAPTPQHPLPR